MATQKRDYKKEYREYHGRPEQIAERSNRNKARRKMAKVVGKAALAGKDVDHIKPIAQGGSNDIRNLRIQSVKANRSRNKRRKK